MWVNCNTPKILRINLQSTLNSRVRQLDNETLMPCLDLRGRGKVKESKVELTKNRLIFGSNLLYFPSFSLIPNGPFGKFWLSALHLTKSLIRLF